MITLPKISCLLVTAAGRLHLAKKSIRCYLDQTYDHRELIVLNEGPKRYQDDLQDYIDSLRREDIKPVWLNGKYSLGTLRNISMYLASGDYFVQWDDDDFCLPHRLMTQYSFFSKHKNAKVCYLSDQLHYFEPKQMLYWNNWKKYHSGDGMKKYSLIPGTGLFKAGISLRYPNEKAGEDTIFAEALLEEDTENVVLLENFGNMHCYTYHGNQVYNLEHHMHIAQMRSHSRAFMMKNRERIIDSLRYLKFGGKIKVMSREGMVFTYEE